MLPGRTEIVGYFIEKVWDIVRPRVDPLDNVLVTCINEKAKSRILIGANRSCPCGQAERAKCDYARARDGAVDEDAVRLVEPPRRDYLQVITHPHFHRAFLGWGPDFRVPLATDSDL